MSRSKWAHACCATCWFTKIHPDGDREPCRMLDAENEWCCFCGDSTREGIYVRRDPETVNCGYLHGQPVALPSPEGARPAKEAT